MSEHKHLLQSFLKSNGFIKFHADTARMLGGTNNDSILLQFLIDRDNFYNADDDWFFVTEEQRELYTNITAYQQREIIKRLKEKGIIESVRKGIPAKTYFKIDYESYYSQLSNYLSPNCEETEQLVNKKLNNTYIDSNNKLSIDSKKVAPSANIEIPFLLKEWRLKEQIPKKQHHPKEGTKQHQKINFLTNLLLKGKFGAFCDLTPEFLKSCNITRKQTARKFSKNELLAGLDEMADMFKLNNLPEDKTAIRKMSFDTLIYHPVAKMSYLLKYMYTDVKGPEYKTIQVYTHWLDKLYKERIFDRGVIEADNYQFGILKKGLAGIEEYYKWMFQNPMLEHSLDTYHLIDSEDKFFNVYVDWFNERCMSFSGNPYTIGHQPHIENNQWYKFIKWLEEAIHGDFVHQFPTLDKRRYENKKI